VSHPIDYSNEWATDADAALVDYANGVISGFVNDVVVYLPSYYNVVSLPSEATDIRTKLQDITNQYLTQMIGGQLDVESSWNDYASEYEQAGASKLETMVNDAITNARNSQ
jgi:capsid portal protein